jgi:ATP-binding cassette, subfamily B, bacterial MsbA
MQAPAFLRRRFNDRDLRLLTRVWREWVRPHRRDLYKAFALMAVAAAATGVYPLLIDQAYEMFADRGGVRVWAVPLAVIAATAVKASAFYAQVAATNVLVQRIVADVRIAMFGHLQRADLTKLQEVPPAERMSIFLNGADVVKTMLTRTVTGLARDLLTVVALTAAMLWLNWAMALTILAVYPLAVLPVRAVGRRLRRLSDDTQTQTGRLLALLSESLSGARLVKTYGLESYEEARAAAAFEENRRLNMAAVRQRARLDPLLEGLGGLAVAAVIAMAGWRISTGAGTVGEFSGFIGALLIAAQPMRALGSLNSALQEGLAAVERIFALLDEAPRIADKPDARSLPKGQAKGQAKGQGRIDFDGAALRYPGAESDALRPLTLTVEAGKTTALAGASGAGKSTLFNLIPRLYDPTGGTVRIDGMDLRDAKLSDVRAAVAVVSQDALLFDDTVAANIAMGKPGATREEIIRAAEAAAADGFIRALPQGYDTPVGEAGATLSGGQRQRIALARAFLKDAPILLLDEATSALDAESERLIQDALARLTAGRTTLIIAHRLSTVRGADRILVMDGGRIVEDGDHADLTAKGGLYARLCATQGVE